MVDVGDPKTRNREVFCCVVSAECKILIWNVGMMLFKICVCLESFHLATLLYLYFCLNGNGSIFTILHIYLIFYNHIIYL